MSDQTMARIGWGLTVLFALFMAFASVMPKLVMDVGAQTMADLGWPEAPVGLIGMLELVCTILFVIPATALLGGIQMMAILGGAMVTQIRADMPLFSNELFSVYLGILMWGALWLRAPRFRALFPIRRD
ncbi:DoxX family protein [Pseudoroseicyclus sp. H15]